MELVVATFCHRKCSLGMQELFSCTIHFVPCAKCFTFFKFNSHLVQVANIQCKCKLASTYRLIFTIWNTWRHCHAVATLRKIRSLISITFLHIKPGFVLHNILATESNNNCSYEVNNFWNFMLAQEPVSYCHSIIFQKGWVYGWLY